MIGKTAATARHWRRLVVCGIVGILLTGVAGCGGRPKKKPKTGGSGSSTETLPAVDLDTALTVDEGRIAVASPTGWTRLPRSKDCLVKYQPGPKKTYPKILVIAEDAPAGFPEVTAENHQAFAGAIAAGVSEALGGAKPLKKPAAVKVGPHLGAFWGIPGSAKVDGIAEPIERWSYAVVIDGRMYTVEARAPKGKIDDAAKAATKAVAAALAPPSAPAAADDTPAQNPSAPAADAAEAQSSDAPPAAEAAAP